jgi:hypothetical protein
MPIPMPIASLALLGALSTDEQQKQLDQHHTVEVIKWLQKNAPADSDELFKIEWHYLPFLNRLHGGEAKVLEQKLASSPAFFCESLQSYSVPRRRLKKRKPKSARSRTNSSECIFVAARMAHSPRYATGWDVQWRSIYSLAAEVKKHCRVRTFGVAMSQIGQKLAHAPQDPGGLWIQRSIATALDSKDVPEYSEHSQPVYLTNAGSIASLAGEEERQMRQIIVKSQGVGRQWFSSSC